jgi:hypothetical protein
MENFFHQFSQYHFKISNISADKISTAWFNYDKTMEVLQNLEKNISENVDKKANPTTLEMFGHFSVIIRATIQTSFGYFKDALVTLSKIGSNHLQYYGKAFGSYLTLFFTPAYCYFQVSEYDKAARLC